MDFIEHWKGAFSFMQFSVLMSVYKNEHPEYLANAIDSILGQTYPASEIVIVEDGPLTPELYGLLTEYSQRCPMLKRVPFTTNRGLGLALRDGVMACSYDWIARMDTDDIAKPERFQRQVEYIESHPEIALVGTAIEEFSNNPETPESQTILPAANEDIIAFSKKRNPFRHMTMMLKKSAILESGNYRDFLWFEDYDLWVRMLQHGFRGANIQEILVSVRADAEMFARRGGIKYLQQDLKFQHFMKQIGYITTIEYYRNICIRTGIRLIPNQWRVWFYQRFLRR